MTGEKPTLWPPLDHTVEGGYKHFTIHIPEFDGAFKFHDMVYDKIWNGTATETLREYDARFYDIMWSAASGMPEQWQQVKLKRYAHICFSVARSWALIVRPTFEAWKPGDPPLKEMYA